jgi:hypothetical protein
MAPIVKIFGNVIKENIVEIIRFKIDRQIVNKIKKYTPQAPSSINSGIKNNNKRTIDITSGTIKCFNIFFILLF